MIGTPTKLGKEFRATAFKIGERLDLETINRWINSNQQPIAKSVHKIDLESISEKSQTLSMAEAKEKYPEWYQNKIVREYQQESIIIGIGQLIGHCMIGIKTKGY
ncbi:hypothetical protein R2F61_09780 (plasmid) [Mollicutes bacterium LVI A0078]|nr:hypothetical protein R2F61_09780 [Mollicutes bacterium LVI A0078]